MGEFWWTGWQLEQVFPCHYHSHTRLQPILLLPEGQPGESWEPSESNALSTPEEHRIGKYFFPPVVNYQWMCYLFFCACMTKVDCVATMIRLWKWIRGSTWCLAVHSQYISFFVIWSIQGVSVFYYRLPHLPSTSPIFVNRSRYNIRHPEVCRVDTSSWTKRELIADCSNALRLGNSLSSRQLNMKTD